MTDYLSACVLLAAGLVGAVKYRVLNRCLSYLLVLVWFELAIEVASTVGRIWFHSNLWAIPLDAAGEIWLLSLVYSWALNSAVFTRWRPWAAGCFVLYSAFSLALDFEPARFKPAVQVLESLLVSSMAALYLRKLLNELQVPSLARDPMFWVSAGLVLYSLSKLLIALFSNYLLKYYSAQLSISVWTVHAVLLLVLHSCYLRALWLRPQK